MIWSSAGLKAIWSAIVVWIDCLRQTDGEPRPQYEDAQKSTLLH